jgi:hypothetical protein
MLKSPLILIGIILLNILPIIAQTQFLGKWIGTITQTGSNKVSADYYFEVNFKMDSITKKISGTSYSYVNKESGKYVLKASLIATVIENKLTFNEIEMLEYQNSIQKHADYCIKFGALEITEDKNKKLILEGTWNGKEHKTENPCAGGTIKLEKTIVDSTNSVVYENEKIIAIKDRIIKKGKTITVHATTLKIEIFDDADEDGDIISLNYNGKWLIDKYKLKNKPLLRTISINPNSPFNFISTFAHNLGKMAPNTTALLIDDGKKKQKIVLKSNLEENDIIYLNYESDEK